MKAVDEPLSYYGAIMRRDADYLSTDVASNPFSMDD
jgi:hypothetical protein